MAIDVIGQLDRRRVGGGAETLAAEFGGQGEAVAEIVFAVDGIVVLPSAGAVVVRAVIDTQPKRELRRDRVGRRQIKLRVGFIDLASWIRVVADAAFDGQLS